MSAGSSSRISAESSLPLVSARNVVKRVRGGGEILRGVSLEIRRGEVVALVGPSGAGKSTLLRCVNYLAPFDAGEIDVAGHKLVPGMRATAGAVRATRQDVGMVFQDFQLFPHLTALENVALGPRRVLGLTREAADARAVTLLARVRLTEKAKSLPSQLSGGQRQRVGIARALAMEPKVLLLDEPTSALDPALRDEVATVILDLKRDGMTMLLVTHDHALASAAANRVVTMNAGRIEGNP